MQNIATVQWNLGGQTHVFSSTDYSAVEGVAEKMAKYCKAQNMQRFEIGLRITVIDKKRENFIVWTKLFGKAPLMMGYHLN